MILTNCVCRAMLFCKRIQRSRRWRRFLCTEWTLPTPQGDYSGNTGWSTRATAVTSCGGPLQVACRSSECGKHFLRAWHTEISGLCLDLTMCLKFRENVVRIHKPEVPDSLGILISFICEQWDIIAFLD